MENKKFHHKFVVLDVKYHNMAHLPHEILRKIFGHFQLKEALNLGLVCHSWNNYVQLSEFMDKIRIGDNGLRNPDWKEFKDLMARSKRNYIHLAIASTEYILGQVLSLSKFNWKTIRMFNFQINKEIIRNVQELAPSLETVRMSYQEDLTSNQLFSLMYPKIQLECAYGYKSVVTLMGKVHANEMTGVNELSISVDSLEKILKTWNFRCPLKKIHLFYNKHRGPVLDRKLSNLVKEFLIRNDNSLVEVVMDCLDNSLMELIFNKLSNIKLVTIGNNLQIKPDLLSLKLNKKIVLFKVHSQFADKFYKKVFEAAPNLEELYVPQMTQSLMEMTVIKLPELTLIYSWAMMIELPDPRLKFKKLKNVKFCHYVNPENIKMSLLFQSKTNKEKMRWMLEQLSLLYDDSYPKIKY